MVQHKNEFNNEDYAALAKEPYNEWRVLTPLLLAGMTLCGIIIGYLVVDKLNAMNDKSDKLFTIIGSVKTSFQDYQIAAEHRFSVIEAKLDDIPKR